MVKRSGSRSKNGIALLEAELQTAKGVRRLEILSELAERVEPGAEGRLSKIADEIRHILADPLSGASRLPQSEHARLEAAALRAQAAEMLAAGEVAGSVTHLEHALALAEKHHDIRSQVRTLKALFTTMKRLQHLDDALAYSGAWRDIARNTGDTEGEAVAMRSMAEALNTKGSQEEAVELLHAASDVFRASGNDLELAKTEMELGDIYWRRAEHDKAFEVKNAALAHFQAAGDSMGEANMYMRLALHYQNLGTYAAALEHHLKAYNLHRVAGSEVGQISSLASMGTVNGLLGNYEAAIDLFRQSLDFSRERGYREASAVALVNIGLALSGMGDNAAAFTALEEALTIARAAGAHQTEAQVLMNIAMHHGETGEYRKSLAYGTQALPLLHRHGNQYLVAICQYNIGLAHLNLDELTAAIEAFQRAITFAEEARDKRQLYDIHRYLAEAYERTGDTANAFAHFKRYSSIKDEVFNSESDERIQRMQAVHRVEQSEREREIFRMKNEKLETELEGRKKDLTAKAMYLSQKNEALTKVRRDISKLSSTPSAISEAALKSIVQNINEALDDQQGWDAFEIQFRAVHPDFVKTLSQKFPDLSPTEVKVCALIMLNLSVKESARILNVSDRSIGQYRYRIRKKLGLGGDKNLSNFLARL